MTLNTFLSKLALWDYFILRKSVRTTLLTLGIVLGLPLFQLPVLAKFVIHGDCRYMSCYELYFVSKRPLQETSLGVLYLTETETHHSSGVSQDNYRVFCSTKKPAVMFSSGEGDQQVWNVNLLNPGEYPIAAYIESSYSIYWATCHNFISSWGSREQARQFGYPLNLEQRQVQLQNLSELFPVRPENVVESPNRLERTRNNQGLLASGAESIRGVTIEPGEVTLENVIGNQLFLVDRLNYRDLSDGSRVLSFDVFNLGYADGVIEIKNANDRIIEVRGIDGVRNPTSVFGFPVETVQRLTRALREDYKPFDPRNALNESQRTEIRNIVIPPGGSLYITKTGPNALRYNQARFVLGLMFDFAPSLFGNDSAKTEFLSKLFVKLQQERIGSLVRDGAFLTFPDTVRSFSTASWIEKENLKKLTEIGLQVLAEQGVQSLSNRVIRERILRTPLSGWIAGAETFARGTGIFLQWYNYHKVQEFKEKIEPIILYS